ncbi:MAG TPA: hypothetical protein PLB48_03520 [Treponema sp.]|uniref:hypothetical protein n=1 Tax=Gracilinema caldarium TaxID=215591 RepID=UPI0026F32E5D|nr:hypothetical protein [Gracilinema caldarium]HON13173.1 hypothetical protein [Treponema sp.]HPC70854.1 hypothetical protein [Treponema sp.]HRS03232.1 hypothetical protein [Treponema sp.]HRU28133.1 hypothetical protein [Treponema sp.]
MKLHRPLSLSIFLYEVVRMVTLLVLSASVRSASFVSPALMAYLLAPQILYVFMALFLWIDESKYHSYLPLYVWGKSISLWAALLWVFTSFQSLVKTIVMYTGSAADSLMIAFAILIPLEIVTIITMGIKLKRSAEDN